MSGEGKKHAALGRPLAQRYEAPPPVTVNGSDFALKVVRNGAVLKVEVPAHMIPAAEHTFPADCGLARIRHGSPELRLIQLNPDDETKIARMVIARYTWERFRERAKNHEEFRQQLEGALNSRMGGMGGVEAGYFEKLSKAAHGETPPSALLDSELEITSYSGDRASIVFIGSSTGDFARAARGDGSDVVKFTAQLEATMSARALADLLASWKAVAEVGAT
jgi:hypothetical protein